MKQPMREWGRDSEKGREGGTAWRAGGPAGRQAGIVSSTTGWTFTYSARLVPCPAQTSRALCCTVLPCPVQASLAPALLSPGKPCPACRVLPCLPAGL